MLQKVKTFIVTLLVPLMIMMFLVYWPPGPRMVSRKPDYFQWFGLLVTYSLIVAAVIWMFRERIGNRWVLLVTSMLAIIVLVLHIAGLLIVMWEIRAGIH